MAVMVVVALAAAMIALGLVVTAVVVLWRAGRDLVHRGGDAVARLTPLRDELLAEQATFQLETDALGRRLRGERRSAA